MGGFLMIFFLVMPGLFAGFGNYFVPIFQGSPEVVYPRVNNFSLLVLILSYFILILSVISEFGSGSGWTLYPPLSTSFMNLSIASTAYLIFGLLFSGISFFVPMHFLGFNLMPRKIPVSTTSIIRRIFNVNTLCSKLFPKNEFLGRQFSWC